MTRKDFVILLAFIFVISFGIVFLFWCVNEVSWDYSIRDQLYDYKEKALIMDFEKFHWEYDFKNIASFYVKFSNGKIGGFNYAKFVDGKIKFESMGSYDGYAIRGYLKYKDGRGITSVCGYYKLFNFYTVEDVIENLTAIDKVIEEMPVVNDYSSSSIYEKSFLQNLPNKVRYEDDEVQVIFFRIKMDE